MTRFNIHQPRYFIPTADVIPAKLRGRGDHGCARAGTELWKILTFNVPEQLKKTLSILAGYLSYLHRRRPLKPPYPSFTYLNFHMNSLQASLRTEHLRFIGTGMTKADALAPPPNKKLDFTKLGIGNKTHLDCPVVVNQVPSRHLSVDCVATPFSSLTHTI